MVTAAKVHEPEVVLDNEVMTPSQACRALIEDALEKQSSAFYDMALGLEEAYRMNYASEWGHKNFRGYVEEHLNMGYRTATYHVLCGRAIRELDVTKERAANIGWTRFKDIADIMLNNPNDAEKYLSLAESLSSRDLTEEIRAQIQTTDGKAAAAPNIRMSLKFTGPAMATVQDAIQLAEQEIGSDDAHACIQHVMAEWLMSKGAVGSEMTLEDWLSFIETNYGCKLQRVESDESLDALLDSEDVTTSADKDVEDLLTLT